MRFILTILLFISLTSQGQIINASAPYRPLSTPLLLDIYTGSTAAYSLMKISSSYSGACIRVRRSSDNTEQDIGFVGNDLDTASMKTFVGSNDGFVATWYSQTGSNNATQTTAANQPRIMLAGVIERANTKPCIRFINAPNMKLNVAVTISQPNSTFIVGQSPTGDNNRHFIDGALSRQIIGYANGNFVLFAGTVLNNVVSGSATSFQLMTALFNGSSSTIQINNGTKTTGAGGSNNLQNPIIGSAQNNQSIDGLISELIFFSNNQSANETGIKSNINTRYSIY